MKKFEYNFVNYSTMYKVVVGDTGNIHLDTQYQYWIVWESVQVSIVSSTVPILDNVHAYINITNSVKSIFFSVECVSDENRSVATSINQYWYLEITWYQKFQTCSGIEVSSTLVSNHPCKVVLYINQDHILSAAISIVQESSFETDLQEVD